MKKKFNHRFRSTDAEDHIHTREDVTFPLAPYPHIQSFNKSSSIAHADWVCRYRVAVLCRNLHSQKLINLLKERTTLPPPCKLFKQERRVFRQQRASALSTEPKSQQSDSTEQPPCQTESAPHYPNLPLRTIQAGFLYTIEGDFTFASSLEASDSVAVV